MFFGKLHTIERIAGYRIQTHFGLMVIAVKITLTIATKPKKLALHMKMIVVVFLMPSNSLDVLTFKLRNFLWALKRLISPSGDESLFINGPLTICNRRLIMNVFIFLFLHKTKIWVFLIYIFTESILNCAIMFRILDGQITHQIYLINLNIVLFKLLLNIEKSKYEDLKFEYVPTYLNRILHLIEINMV